MSRVPPAWLALLPPVPECRVLDLSPPCHAAAALKSYWAAIGAFPTRWIPENATARPSAAIPVLPFSAGSMDFVHLGHLAALLQGHDSRWLAELLRAVRRILEPRGILVVYASNARWVRMQRCTLSAPPDKHHQFRCSEPQLRRMLMGAGFRSLESYWCDPSVEEPTSLVPLTRACLLNHIQRSAIEGWANPPRQHRIQAKSLLAWIGMFPTFAPDFLFVATPSSTPPAQLSFDALRRAGLALPDSRPTQLVVTGSGIFEKLVVAIRYAGGGPYLSTFVRTDRGIARAGRAIEREQEITNRVGTVLSSGTVSLPQPLGVTKVGSVTYSAETGLRGSSLASVLMTTPAWLRVSLARRHLIAAARISIVITQRLRADETVCQLARLNNANPMTTDCRDELGPWVQHGDFTIENLYLVSDRSYGLIDWEHLSVHSVPLYDAVSLLLSAIPLLRGRRTDNWTAVDGFRTAFLGDGAWAYLFRSILSFTAKELGVPQHEVRDAFVFCLRERVSYHRERASILASVHEAFVRLAVEYYPAHEEKPDLVRS